MPPPLNAAQFEAVHTLGGPLLVLAGAGTGKTRVVTYRIAELIKSGIRPERILAVTFTNKAAAEMQQRSAELLGRRSKSRPEISTFHSLAVRILRRHIRRLGYPEKFAIYDRGDQEGLARSALRQIKVPGSTLRPGDLLGSISRWKSASIRPGQASAAAQSDKEHLAAAAYGRYQKDLKAAGAVDFDDLLLLTETLFAKFVEVRRVEARRFDHLLIDEYQDTNQSQYQIIKALAAGHRNLCVVGDDDQSIYGWRGAEVAHILAFQRDWPDAKVVRLEENYRSSPEILSLANRLIAFNKQRHPKVLRPFQAKGDVPAIWQLPDEETEAMEVVDDIRRRLQLPGGGALRDYAILFRTNEQPRAFEQELRRANVPYVLIGGMSFYDRSEVRDVLSYLKLLVNPNDEVALLRVINKPARGIGQSTVSSLTARAVESGQPLWKVLPDALRQGELPEAAARGIGELRGLVNSFGRRARSEPLADLARDLLATIRFREHLARIYPDEAEFDTRHGSIEEVINALARYGQRADKPTLGGFLTEVVLAEREDEDDKQSQLARNAVVLMTLHSAKGLEFPNVYLVGMEEGILPHRRSLADGDQAVDEERRLCYVGVTRAQQRLTMSLSLTRMKWGKARESVPSRFLFELIGKADNPHTTPKPAGKRRAGKKRRGKPAKTKKARPR